MMMKGTNTKKQSISASLISQKEYLGHSIIIIIAKIEKNMQRVTLKTLVDTQTSIKAMEYIKPCLKKQNSSDKSTIVRQSSVQLLKNSFLRDFNQDQELKKDDNRSDVSLQEDILDDHKQTLQQLFRNSFLFFSQEKGLKNLIQKQERFSSAIFKQITLEHYLHVLLEKLQSKKPALVNLFHLYLREDKIFYRFLQHIYYSYPSLVVNRAFRYIFYTWQLYYPYLHQQVKIKEIEAIAGKIFQKILRSQEDSRMRSLTLSDTFWQQKRQLIEVLTLTVALVMEKCFSNPYLHDFNKIQKSSEQQDLINSEQGLIPRKSIKRECGEV